MYNPTPMPMYRGVKFIPKYNAERHFPKLVNHENVPPVSRLVKASSVNKIHQVIKPVIVTEVSRPPIPTRPRLPPVQHQRSAVALPMVRVNKAVSVSNLAEKSEILKSRNEITTNLKNQLQNFRIRKTSQFEMNSIRNDVVSGGECRQVAAKKHGAPMNTEMRALKRQESTTKKKTDDASARSQSSDRNITKTNVKSTPIESTRNKCRNVSTDKTFVV
jgi:hypothetical protein